MFALQDSISANDLSWDKQHKIEDYFKLFEGLNGLIGQKDADLLWWKNSHPRLAKFLPDTKFIFVLRNPVKRAESQYWNEVRKGRETRTFSEALIQEEKGQLSPWQQLHLCYRERGNYVNSLVNFYNYVPKERSLVVVLEHLFKNWDEEISRICSFLEIPPEKISALQSAHTNKEDVPVLNPKLKPFWPLIRFYDKIVNFIIRRSTKDKIRKSELQQKFLRLGKVSARALNPITNEELDDLYTYYNKYNLELEELTGLDTSIWNLKE
jgi:hypothetical protein